MGKALVPIVRNGSGYRAEFAGTPHELDGEDELAAFRRVVEVGGFYSTVVEQGEFAALRSDPLAVKGRFDDLARERLASWIALAEEELAGTDVRCYLTGGNDDTPEVLTVLDEAQGEHVVACEGRLVDLDGVHTMITVGYSSPTPWDTPRERSEEEIAAAIEDSATRVPDPSRCLFNLHAPPKDTPIDVCVKLYPTTGLGPGEFPRPVRMGNRVVTTGGGSRAVRNAIATYQPLVGLHGHIHESPGRFRMGRTQCFNPGSEYQQGVLNGVLFRLSDGALTGYQHTSG